MLRLSPDLLKLVKEIGVWQARLFDRRHSSCIRRQCNKLVGLYEALKVPLHILNLHLMAIHDHLNLIGMFTLESLPRGLKRDYALYNACVSHGDIAKNPFTVIDNFPLIVHCLIQL